ncbi:glutamyl-tRNA(Gln) amidotransferase subunit A [Microlunatus endophyticus]|uniref:Glutamyl-tRNA(Gln) amidotransferase subunit A n=1 Tax=Microlunatus endophyticus TaxID=1716077 RepID=A0A917SB46_9ACTN|nr:amidase [Microlunatus endophyticus]GGL69375.1 glutamyl-tRNA(Gln) amidotransferase subunit A [Microlunatus endophyticus]
MTTELATPGEESAATSTILTIADAGEALRSGTTTSVELTTAMLEKATALNPALGAYVEITSDLALEQAEAADAAFSAGSDAGPLQGIPLAIKDIIKVAGVPTTANSRILDPAWGGEADAPVVARLRAAGSVFIGKSTTSEFALGQPDAEKGFPVPHNPWDVTRTPAGSSSGTGVATAAGLAFGGLGTDTGGSVRGPATVNGHSGLKVTFGRVPKAGVVPLGYSLDSIGPMARSAYDCALLLQVMAGYDAADPNAADVPVPSYTAALDGSVEGVKIGLPIPYFFDHDQLDPEVRDGVLSAVQALVGLGATSTEMELAHADKAQHANALILVGEAYAYHRNNMVQRWTTYGKYTRPGLVRGMFYTAADFVQANRFRVLWCEQVAKALQTYDVLITPSAPTTAQVAADMNPSQRLRQPSYTGQWNLSGLPAICIPTGFSSEGLPLSMQIIGKPFAEATVLKIADAYQRITDHHLQVPPVDALITTAA